MYLIGSCFSWIAYIFVFYWAREGRIKDFFSAEFIGGSIGMILGWPLGILYFIFIAIFGKTLV
jgi:hypothetical protein